MFSMRLEGCPVHWWIWHANGAVQLSAKARRPKTLEEALWLGLFAPLVTFGQKHKPGLCAVGRFLRTWKAKVACVIPDGCIHPDG